MVKNWSLGLLGFAAKASLETYRVLSLLAQVSERTLTRQFYQFESHVVSAVFQMQPFFVILLLKY